MKKGTEKAKRKLSNLKDDILRPVASRRPSSRASAHAPTSSSSAKSTPPIPMEDVRPTGISVSMIAGEEAQAGPSGASRLRHATPCPNAIITYIAGDYTDSSFSLSPRIGASSSRLDPVLAPMIPLNSVHSVSVPAGFSIATTTIASPSAISPLPSLRSSALETLPPAITSSDDGANLGPNEPIADQSAKPASKLEQWWLDHRKGIVSGVKTVLKVASKVLDDIPAGGSTAAKVLEYGVEALERVQVMLARRS
jgi:hypothetical protein